MDPNTAKALRIKNYKRRYKYNTPRKRKPNEVLDQDKQRAKICETGGPDYPGFFTLSARARSHLDEDRIIYKAFFRDQMEENRDKPYVC